MKLSVLYSCIFCGVSLLQVVLAHSYRRKMDVMPTMEVIKRQSLKCNINCPYGFVSDVEGEATCNCYDPCSTVLCFEGQECVAWMPDSCRWKPCRPQITCQKVPKITFTKKVTTTNTAIVDPKVFPNDPPYLPAQPSDGVCDQALLSAAVTSCKNRRRRWYYSPMTGQCVRFYGCHTEGNNFARKRDCKDKCRKNTIHPAILLALAADDSHCFEAPPMASRDCSTKQRHWFYNEVSGKCEKFTGCDSSNTRNIFTRKLLCKAKCHQRMRKFRLDAIFEPLQREQIPR